MIKKTFPWIKLIVGASIQFETWKFQKRKGEVFGWKFKSRFFDDFHSPRHLRSSRQKEISGETETKLNFLDSSWSWTSSEDPGDEDRREKRRQTTDADDVVGVGAVALVAGADADVHVPAVVDRLVAGGVTVLSIRNGDIRQVAGNYKVAFSPRQISHWLHFLLG